MLDMNEYRVREVSFLAFKFNKLIYWTLDTTCTAVYTSFDTSTLKEEYFALAHSKFGKNVGVISKEKETSLVLALIVSGESGSIKKCFCYELKP